MTQAGGAWLATPHTKCQAVATAFPQTGWLKINNQYAECAVSGKSSNGVFLSIKHHQ